MSDREPQADNDAANDAANDPDNDPGTTRPDHAGPDDTRDAGQTPPTELEESDPNADSAVGLAGGMGVSSERPGPVRGVDEDVTYGAAPTHPPTEEGVKDTPPEQSAHDGEPEVHPDNDVPAHPRNPDGNPGHLGS